MKPLFFVLALFLCGSLTTSLHVDDLYFSMLDVGAVQYFYKADGSISTYNQASLEWDDGVRFHWSTLSGIRQFNPYTGCPYDRDDSSDVDLPWFRNQFPDSFYENLAKLPVCFALLSVDEVSRGLCC